MILPRLFVVLFFAVPTAVSAQFGSTSFEVHAGYYDWGGDNVESLQGSWRVQGAAFGSVWQRVSLGATFHYGRGGIDGSDGNLAEVGAVGVARLLVGAGDGMQAFLDANVGWSQLRLSARNAPFPTIQENGLTLGPSLGVSFPIAEDLRIHVTGDATYNKYGDLTFARGVGTEADGDSAWRYGVRIGLGFAGN